MINYEGQSLLIYLVIVVYIGIRRLMPRKFRKTRMYIWPIAYVILLLLFSFQLRDYFILLLLPPLGVAGYFVGYKLLESNKIEFFFKNGTLYYKWPYSITLTWIILYIFRTFLDFFALNCVTISIIDLLLAFSTGILISASTVTLRKAKNFR
ncbi:hypothetical protein [Acidianus sp. HS-5]|uniref:hypothetical protein n=1 Tax=Acidianus sp. HS-5 TaxID=2886040 RepID=UPI001F1A6834|nr:hypothetical protein [Acidianus sp. HS-5]BDC18742.1 hypothetical protein HS5_16320 [Acidianus sp. HS-5]